MASISPQFVKPWLSKSSPPQYLFKNATVVDPVTGTSTPVQHVLVQNGAITAVVSDESALPSRVMSNPEHMSMLRMTYVCRDIITRGFTTVRDCGGAPYALKQTTEEWLVPGPRLFISGRALSQTDGHGDFRNCHDHTHCASGFVSGLEEGADFIKIMGGSGVVSPTDRLEGKQFIPEEIHAVVLAASNHGTYVTCHTYAPEFIRVVIENGVKGIEHGNLIDEPTAKLMAEKGSHPQFLNEDSQAKNSNVLDMGINALKIAKDAGLTLCYGTSSNLDILQSATINPARMIGEADTLGQVKTGFKADLSMLSSTPLSDITVFERQEEEVVAAIKDGRVCLSKTPELTGLIDAWATF
ncbi:hypothetical protein FDECE_5544 [Fusarium decemcellulare]|nr:hypothetical protein FDECE_5544 [Fusarium decemcellulare]